MERLLRASKRTIVVALAAIAVVVCGGLFVLAVTFDVALPAEHKSHASQHATDATVAHSHATPNAPSAGHIDDSDFVYSTDPGDCWCPTCPVSAFDCDMCPTSHEAVEPVVHARFENLTLCTTDAQEGDVCLIDAFLIKPTEMAFAVQEMLCKQRHLEEDDDPLGELTKRDHHVPLVIGPGGVYYLTDHHHFTRALLESNLPRESKFLQANIRANWKDVPSRTEFWQLMMQHGYTWLSDEKGHYPQHFMYLPETLFGMVNDPYRMLAYLARKNGGFNKSRKLYAEYYWANYFRERIVFNTTRLQDGDYVEDAPYRFCESAPYSSACFPDEQEQLERMTPVAVRLAWDDGAKDLPGYSPNPEKAESHDGDHVCGFGFYFDEVHAEMARRSTHM